MFEDQDSGKRGKQKRLKSLHRPGTTTAIDLHDKAVDYIVTVTKKTNRRRSQSNKGRTRSRYLGGVCAVLSTAIIAVRALAASSNSP